MSIAVAPILIESDDGQLAPAILADSRVSQARTGCLRRSLNHFDRHVRQSVGARVQQSRLAQGGIQLSQMVVPTRINSGLNVGPGAYNRWG
jgi:hypothetical protein